MRTVLATMLTILLLPAGAANAAVLAYDDFEYIADGTDITSVNFPRDRGFAKWSNNANAVFTATSAGAISGTISGQLTDGNPAGFNAGADVNTDAPALSSNAGMDFWVGAKIWADQAPLEGLSMYVKIGTSGGAGFSAGLRWFPTSNSKWRAHDATVANSGTAEDTPVPNKVFDVLFEIRQTDYDVFVNGELILANVTLGNANIAPNFVANINFLTGEILANGTTTVIVDDVAVYNADPRIGVETPGTDFLLVQDLQPNSRIDDGAKYGDDVIWTSMNGGFTAYKTDGSVAKGVVDIHSENQTATQNPIDFAASGGLAEYIGYFASAGNPGGPNDLEATDTEYPAGLTSNFGFPVPKIITSGVRLEAGIPRPVMFVVNGSNLSRYRTDIQAFAGNTSVGALATGHVDLGYNAPSDTAYWATAAGNLYAHSVAGATTTLIATDARIDAGSKINGGSWNGTQGVLVSYNDGTWEVFDNTGASVDAGNFAHSSGNPLDVSLGNDRIYYLADVGGITSDLYTLTPPPPGVPCATIEAEVLLQLCAAVEAGDEPTSLSELAALVTSLYVTVSADLGGSSDLSEADCLELILTNAGL